MSNSLWPHGLQHARLPCPSLSPKVCSNSYPLVRWCHPTISFSVAPFSCPQSFPASESFPVSQLLTSILKYWSFIFSISPSSEYSGLISFRIDLVWSPCHPRDSHESSPAPHLKVSILWNSAFFMVQLAHSYTTNEQTIALTIWIFFGKGMALLFNALSRFLIAFLPRNKHLLISWLQSLSTVDFWAHENKIWHCLHFFPFYVDEVMGPDPMILVFWMLTFKPTFSLPISFSLKGYLIPLHFLPLKWYHAHIWGCWYLFWQSWFQLVIYPAQHFPWCTLHRS